MPKIAVIAQHRHPLAQVRRAERQAARAEATFQLAVLEAIDLSQEPEDKRALAQSWLRALREMTAPRFEDILRTRS